MKNKKGSHIGFVISFIVFATFIVFMYILLNPSITKEREKNYILEYVESNLVSNASSEITSVTINVDESSGSHDCINIQNIPEATIPSEMRDNLIIKNSDGESLDYEEQGNGLEIETGTNFIGVLNVYYSEDIIGNQISLGGCDPKPTTTGAIKTSTELFESGFSQLKSDYENDYSGFKVKIGIPEGTDFNFYVYDSERSEPPIISAENQEAPTDRSVYVDEFPIQYIGENGGTAFGFLVVQVFNG